VIEKDAAVAIARHRAAQKGWAFSEPIDVEHRRGWSGKPGSYYKIETNAGKLGTKARFVIDAETGDIVREGYLAR
jgi:uncharacterized membrane protein YkoI